MNEVSEQASEVGEQPSKEKCTRCADRIMWISVGTTSFLAITKGTIGVIAGSMALVADAFHSLADVLCSIVTLIGVYIGRKPPDKGHPYGHGKSEFIAGVVLGVVLLFGAAAIVVTAVGRIWGSAHYPAPHFLAMFGAAISIAINETMYRVGSCAALNVNSSAIEAEAWDNRSDAISSVPVFFGVLGAQFGLTWLDPLVAVFVGLIVGKVGFGLVNKNLAGLMDGPIGPGEVNRMRELTAAVPGVEAIEMLRTRGMGRRWLADLRIVVDGRTTVEQSNAIAHAVEHTLRREIAHLDGVTIVCRSLGDGQEAQP